MIAFSEIPSNIRVPLFYAELDRNFTASSALPTYRTLIVGQRTSGGSVEASVLTPITSAAQARAAFGAGSHLARMCELYLKNDPMAVMYAIALDDADGSTKALGRVTFSGTATEAGSIFLTIGGQRVVIPVAVGDSASTIGAAFEALLDSASGADLPVTHYLTAGGQIDVQARNAGTLGNRIRIHHNYRGAAGGEVTPAGITVELVQPTGGATDPDPSDLFETLTEEAFRFIVQPFTADAAVDSWDEELLERWGPMRAQYAHMFTAAAGDYATHLSWGANRNSPHVTCFCVEPMTASVPWEVAAAGAGQVAKSSKAHPARPTWTLVLRGILPAPRTALFDLAERNGLLLGGCATCKVTPTGELAIERAITTYQTTPSGSPDTTYLDSTSPLTLAYLIDRLRARIEGKFPRAILVDDGTPFSAGLPVVTPGIIKGELIAAYEEEAARAIVENVKTFAEYLIVERNADDPNRVDVLYPPDLANQLAIFATLVRPYLQFPAAAGA